MVGTAIEQKKPHAHGWSQEAPHGARDPFWRADSRDSLLGHPHRPADPPTSRSSACGSQPAEATDRTRAAMHADRAAAVCNVRPRRATNRRTGRAAAWSATRDADGGPSGIACNAVGSESVWLNARETCATRAVRGSPRRPIGAVSSVKIERPSAREGGSGSSGLAGARCALQETLRMAKPVKLGTSGDPGYAAMHT